MRAAARLGRLVVLSAVGAAGLHLGAAAQDAPLRGARDPGWAPDGARIAVAVLDQIWTMTPDGREPRPLAAWPRSTPAVVEREPAWAHDGTRIAFAADLGDGFDLYVAQEGAAPRRLTFTPGDERQPSWTPDGRIVFAYRAADQWDLMVINVDGSPVGVPPAVHALVASPADERYPSVSPDGTRLAYVSSQEDEQGADDVWVRTLDGIGAPFDAREGDLEAAVPRNDRPVRVTATRARESHPVWDPQGTRVAYASATDGEGAVWVAPVPAPTVSTRARSRPAPEGAILVSRQRSQPAWSPDGRVLLLAGLPGDWPAYNGNPTRAVTEMPPVFAGSNAFALRTVPAPLPPDAGAENVRTTLVPESSRWQIAFDRSWQLLRDLYYRTGPAADAWQALRTQFASRAASARSSDELEQVVDELVAQQPLARPAVQSGDAVVVSGHRLASEAGARILADGGNIVDAAVAVSFALGVVEPDASGIGGDGMALLFLNGMKEPLVVDYKDQSPIHATLTNAAIYRDGRIVGDGPAAANIPGVVAGMDHLFRRYGSGRVSWAQVMAPAIGLAADGYELDEALPTTVREGRALLERWPEAARVFLPRGQAPRAGERFVNPDYASTLRTVASEGADAFYRGSIAKRIAADMEANGGIIGLEDLAQYQVIERQPVSGRYRGLQVFGAPPPVPTGTALIETLQILEGYREAGGALAQQQPDYLHYVIEAWKARDPLRRVADPALWPVEVAPHLDPTHAGALFERIDRGRALPFGDESDTAGQGGQGDRIGRGTTAFVIGDTAGNVIVVTQTLSTWGGSFYVSKGLGFLYNNHLRGYRTVRGAYGQLLPLMRSSSTSAPTLVCETVDGVLKPRLALGAAGNAWIAASVYNILLAHVDGGLGAQAAIEAPRLLVARDPSDPAGLRARVQVEDRFPRQVLDALTSRGHQFQKIGRKGELRYGYAAVVQFDHAARRVEAGTEPRRSHFAVAVQR
ncbi:MAG TPA: gamma-glutamyltransferase [Luteitalea sp.]|nr:gamma-glutamyltransferase [Luteitalea sp.]